MGGTSFSSSSSISRTRGSSSKSSLGRSYIPLSSCSEVSSSREYSTQVTRPVQMKIKYVCRPYDDWQIMTFFAIICAIYVFLKKYVDGNAPKTSVLKVQVGLLGTAKSLQADLNRIAEVADTSTQQGLSYILQATTLALLRHPDYYISGYSSVDVKRSEFDCENRFNNLSIEERVKFDKETLINVNNIKKKIVTSHGSDGVCNEYIVVTIIVAARGILQLPPIRNNAQLKDALQTLASISPSNILAAEVLWTPQEENDILSEQKMLEDYPRLHPV